MPRRNRSPIASGPLRGQRLRSSLIGLSLLTVLVAVAIASLLARPAHGAPVDLGREIVKSAAPHYRVDWINEPERENARLDPLELNNLQRQRARVSALVRRHFGQDLTRTERDLELLQRVVDEKLIDPKREYDLQALGVALGDVMVEELGFQWVAHVDDEARTRALRKPGSQDVVFPVTMISRRVQAGARVDVGALFAEASEIAQQS